MPNLHPLLVHFPIALLLLALILEVIALLRVNPEISRAAWWNQIGGTVSLALAVASGLLAQNSVQIPGDARGLFERHEQLAFVAAALFAVLFFWRVGGRGRLPKEGSRLYLLLFVAGVACLLTGALYGGEMVYRCGVGVR